MESQTLTKFVRPQPSQSQALGGMHGISQHARESAEDDANHRHHNVAGTLDEGVGNDFIALGSASLCRRATLETTKEFQTAERAAKDDGEEGSCKAGEIAETGNNEQDRSNDAQQPAPSPRLLEVNVLAAELRGRVVDGGLAHSVAEIFRHVFVTWQELQGGREGGGGGDNKNKHKHTRNTKDSQTWHSSHTRKHRRKEGAKKRKNERTKERKNERKKERRQGGGKEKANEKKEERPGGTKVNSKPNLRYRRTTSSREQPSPVASLTPKHLLPQTYVVACATFAVATRGNFFGTQAMLTFTSTGSE